MNEPWAATPTIETFITALTNAAATGTYLALGSVLLPAGVWWLSAVAVINLNGATFAANSTMALAISTDNGGSSLTNVNFGYDFVSINGLGNSFGATDNAGGIGLVVPKKVVRLTTPTLYYCNVRVDSYTVATPQWRGSISATLIPGG